MQVDVQCGLGNNDLLTNLAEMIVRNLGLKVKTRVKSLLKMDHRPIKVQFEPTVVLTLDADFKQFLVIIQVADMVAVSGLITVRTQLFRISSQGTQEVAQCLVLCLLVKFDVFVYREPAGLLDVFFDFFLLVGRTDEFINKVKEIGG